MTKRRMTPAMTERLAAVREAMTKLSDHHYVWMIDAALEHFAATVGEMETNIVRFEGIPDKPIFTRFGKSRREGLQATTREHEVRELRASLEVHYAILEFLELLKNAASLHSAEVFATSIDWSTIGQGPRDHV